MQNARPLDGRTIAITEHRFERELVLLVEGYGGQVLSCPLLEECRVGDLPDLDRFVRETIDPGFDFVVFFTGVGFRFLYDRAVEIGLPREYLEALGQTTVVARGPKPQSAMRKLKMRADLMPGEATSEGLIDLLSGLDLSGMHVAIQLYGTPNPSFCGALEERGARLRTVQVYDYRPVSDGPQVAAFIRKLLGDEVDAVTFTSAPQINSLFGHADRLGETDNLVRRMNDQIVVVAVGGVTNRALESRGVRASVIPPVPKMGRMVQSMAEYFDQKAPR